MKSMRRMALRDSEYVGPRTSRAIAGLLLVAGLVAAVGGVGYAINGATQAPESVTVPISIETADGVVRGPVPVNADGVVVPDGARLQAAEGGLQLVAEGGASRWTGFLARGDAALIGLAFGACALLLVPVVNAVAAGDPFRPGNAARIGWTGAIVGVVGMVAPALPNLAALAVYSGFDAAEGANPFAVVFGFGLAPIGIAALIFVLAEAFRRGTQISADTAGLV
ncbi:DUF2975 domain-containing protein [Pengzhenrongella frigida]|uniref:DUF2975 domain-containing protein n=1 Tax=Pengzhenrongella frigida TaxID=1259133 RepID=A0A4V1ZHA4_9MICO|nr:DUF2975 domain-containing protein [Cellulomonas sp. HLT2-17]RYV51354.1 DUF2975 domain-containing protein [Cellulomonas sp. HLT2-17]